jgi:nucleotide-binding universal stress UspA family protein
VKDIRKILVPVDFSAPAQQALDEAIRFAKKFRAELHLLHCYQLFLPSTLSLYRLDVDPSIAPDFREAAQRLMAEWSQRVSAAGVSSHEHLASNLPSAEAADLAGKIGADLIVIGTQGLSGLKHLLLGSVAERTIRIAPCPVLTVGLAAGGSTTPDARPWSSPPEKIAAKEIHRILVPVDFSEHSERALEAAIALATAFGAEVHLLHSYQIYPDTISLYGIVVPESLERDLRAAALKRLSESRDKVRAAGCKVEQHVTASVPVDAIAQMAERFEPDLIVIGTRGLGGFKHALLGSVAERTIRTAKCPVLSVKSGAPG